MRSSELKAEPSPFRPTNPAARALDEALVAEGYGWFRGLVGERRGLEGPALDRVANGAVFTGRLALENGLIDEIGGEPEAIAWLESRDAALGDLPVRDWEVEDERPFWTRLVAGIAVNRRDSRGNIAFGRPQALFPRSLIPASMAAADRRTRSVADAGARKSGWQ